MIIALVKLGTDIVEFVAQKLRKMSIAHLMPTVNYLYIAMEEDF